MLEPVYSGCGRLDLPPDPKPPVAPAPPNGFVVDEVPKPEPKPVRGDEVVRIQTGVAQRDALYTTA